MANTYMPRNLDRKSGAKAMGRDLPISPKVSIEICNFLRGMEVEHAIETLVRVTEKTQAIPYKRFSNGPGHKPGKGVAAGRYPIKAAGEFLKLLKNAKANASNQGLTGELIITHIAAQRANEPFRARAKERVTFKRAHVEVILTEGKAPRTIKAEKRAEQAAKKNAKPAKKTDAKANAEAEQTE